MHRHATGFSLIEMMATLLIAALLLGVAIPAWSNATSAVHNGATRGALASDLMAAVQRSALTGSEVVVCPRSSTGQCSGATDWSEGWIVFSDGNGNRIRDAGESTLRETPALPGGVRLHTTAGRTRLVFQPNGGNAGSNVTFTLCDKRGVAKASTLVLANDGRLRQGTPTAAAANACVYGQ